MKSSVGRSTAGPDARGDAFRTIGIAVGARNSGRIPRPLRLGNFTQVLISEAVPKGISKVAGEALRLQRLKGMALPGALSVNGIAVGAIYLGAYAGLEWISFIGPYAHL